MPMQLRYYDRRGREVQKERWWELFRDPGVFYVRQSRAGRRQVVTCFVGVAEARDRIPMLFCVESKEVLRPEDSPRGYVPERPTLAWVATERDALKLHAILEAGARREAG